MKCFWLCSKRCRCCVNRTRTNPNEGTFTFDLDRTKLQSDSSCDVSHVHASGAHFLYNSRRKTWHTECATTGFVWECAALAVGMRAAPRLCSQGPGLSHGGQNPVAAGRNPPGPAAAALWRGDVRERLFTRVFLDTFLPFSGSLLTPLLRTNTASLARMRALAMGSWMPRVLSLIFPKYSLLGKKIRPGRWRQSAWPSLSSARTLASG